MSADGFHDDCMDLITTYCNRNSTDFQQFCEDWKQKGFHYVFYGHIFQHELLLYTENCFAIMKSIFISSTTLAERLATLYLMYAMYFKQPTKEFCKFRFTLKEWTKMKSFYGEIGVQPKYLQARSIFWRMWQCHAFRFVESELEQCPETIQFHCLNNAGLSDFQKINSTIIGTINNLQNENNGILSAIETLQVGYNEMKDHFATNMKECANLRNTDVVATVTAQLEKVKTLFETKYEGRFSRRRTRGQNSLAGPSRGDKNHESDYESELNASNYSYSDSNDDNESHSGRSDDDAMNDECLDIGSKRYYLKRRAAQQESGEMHRLKSTVVQSPKKSKHPPRSKSESNRTHQASDAEREESQANFQQDSNDVIVINHMKKVYNRHSKEYVSTMRKQFTDCPTEVSKEIDTRSPRKRAKLK